MKKVCCIFPPIAAKKNSSKSLHKRTDSLGLEEEKCEEKIVIPFEELTTIPKMLQATGRCSYRKCPKISMGAIYWYVGYSKIPSQVWFLWACQYFTQRTIYSRPDLSLYCCCYSYKVEVLWLHLISIFSLKYYMSSILPVVGMQKL